MGYAGSERGKYSRSVMGSIHGGFVLTGVVTTLLGPILPVLSTRWSLNDAQAGYLFTSQFVGTTAGALLSGSLDRRLGRLRSLAAGFSLMAIGVAALAMASWLVGLASTLCYGLGLGLVIPLTNLLVAEANAVRSATALNVLNMAWGVGAVVWPLVAAAVIRSAGADAPLFVLALLLAAVAFWMASPRYLPANHLPDRKGSFEAGASPWSDPWLPLLGALFFLYVGTENAVGGWAASYAQRLSTEPGSPWAMAPSFFWAALLVGRGLAPAILRRVAEANLALVGLMIATLGVTTLLATRRLEGVFAGVAVAGLGLASVFPITIAMLSHHFGALAARVAGATFALAGLGGATLPWLVGFVSNHCDSLRMGLAVPLLATLVMLALHFGHARAPLANALGAGK